MFIVCQGVTANEKRREKRKKVFDENNSEVNHLFPDIRVPKLLFSKTESNGLILLLEFVDGKKLNSLTPKYVKNYQNILEFIDYIDKKFKEKNFVNIQNINPFVIAGAYVLLIANTQANYPKYIKYDYNTTKELALDGFSFHQLDHNGNPKFIIN